VKQISWVAAPYGQLTPRTEAYVGKQFRVATAVAREAFDPNGKMRLIADYDVHAASTGEPPMNRPVLVVLEGANDWQFLVRLTTRLRIELPYLPDLLHWHSQGKIVMVPVGGGDPISWPERFQPLGFHELHLYDREQWPETDVRQRAIDRVNARPGCRGALTSKRSVENFLHTDAISAAGGGELNFGDHDPVGSLLARSWYRQTPACLPWESLSRRTQRRLTARAKRWLNTIAILHMTAHLLAERDPAGEVLGWLQTIRDLVEMDRLSTACAEARPRI